MEKPDHRLLCPRRERPHHRSAAKQRNEIAASQLIELHPIPVSRESMSAYRTGRGQSAGMRTISQPAKALESASGLGRVETPERRLMHGDAGDWPVFPVSAIGAFSSGAVLGMLPRFWSLY
jgi:hypothetical protein